MLGMPSINITFVQQAIKETRKQEQGIVALLLREEVAEGKKREFEILPDADLEQLTVSEENQEQIRLSLIGNDKKPKKTIVYLIGNDEDYTDALHWLEVQKFQYLAVPTVETDGKAKMIADWIIKQRKNKKTVKAVLPNYAADNEYIINYATEMVFKNDTSYTTEQYCSRIAGLLAGTSLTSSCTYAELEELTDCSRLDNEALDAEVRKGKLVVFHDGEKVKIARGVNSLITITKEKGKQFKKIKIMEVMDAITESITKTVKDNYIGKIPNSYDNKCLLISELQDYAQELIKNEILSRGSFELDTVAIKEYLKNENIDLSEVEEEEIKKMDTEDKVFLRGKNLKIQDVIEEINVSIEV